jgi:hypothetical protein
MSRGNTMRSRSSLGHSRWLAVVLVMALGAMGFPVMVTAAPPTTEVGISAPSGAIAPGEEFAVEVAVVPSGAIAGMQFDLSFDASLAAVSSVQEGDLLNQAGASTFFNPGTINNTEGTVTGVFGAITTPGATVSTSGTFASIAFTARTESGSCPFSLSNVVVGDAGGNSVAVSVTDGAVSIDQAPALEAIGDKSVKEGATLSFTVLASDPDGDVLTYSASNLPIGAAFEPATQVFSWTPGLSQAGTYSGVHFQVSDGHMIDYEDISISVIDELPPVLVAIGDRDTSEGETLSFAISGTDANGDALAYSASNLPVGATFDPVTRTFSWTPSHSQAGTYAGVRFEVSDGLMTDYEEITITVDNMLRPDVNDDGSVNVLDMITIGQHWSETGAYGWIRQDINEDGMVNVLDATLIGQHWTG